MKTPLEWIILFVYFAALLSVIYFSYKKQKSDADFLLGNRSLNFWLTALSAHASDMSGWLFLGYPALVFSGGVFATWAAIGLIIGMFLNWQWVAPRLRIATEHFGSLTLSAYFEKRFEDPSGILRFISGFMSLLFFTIYISSGLIAMGVLVESLLGLSYYVGIVVGLGIVVSYVFLGGYRTVAWIDLFQGCFLLAVIVAIPLYLLAQFGGFQPVLQAVAAKQISTSLLPSFEIKTFWNIFLTAAGWGLGYFGQPHILTKFMGIKDPSEIHKAKYVGISWQTIALGAATVVGLIGIFLFPQGLADPQQVILSIVKKTLSPLFAGLVLCAILAATTNVMSAHILIVASNLSEDFYKRVKKSVSPSELLWVSRLSVIAIGLVALSIAFFKPSTIYQLVLYSWSGLGASFGPLVLLSLYMKRINKQGAFAGILTGGLTAALWPYFDAVCRLEIPSIIPAFAFSLGAIYLVSLLTYKPYLLRKGQSA